MRLIVPLTLGDIPTLVHPWDTHPGTLLGIPFLVHPFGIPTLVHPLGYPPWYTLGIPAMVQLRDTHHGTA